MIELMFPRTVSNILDYDAIKAAAKKYVEDAFIDIIASFGDNLVLQTMDEEHLSVVSEHVAGNPTLTLQELLDYINTDHVYKEKEFVDGLAEHFGNHVEYKLLEGYTIYKHDHTPLTTGYGKAGVIILNVDDTASVINSNNGMTAIDEWIGENAASKLPINLYIEFQNNLNVDGVRPGETTPAYWRSYPYIEEEVFVTNDPYYAIPEPSPGPEPPTPSPDWEDVTDYPIAIEISASGTSMSNVVCTKQGSDELDLTRYRINPAVMDMEANGYDFVALAKFLANNKLYQAFMSAAKVTYTAYTDNEPYGYGVFQFNKSGALGNSSDSSWNTLVGLPLKFEPSGGDTTYNGFVTKYNASYPYPNTTQQIGRVDSTGMVDALHGSSYTDGHFIVDNGAEGAAAELVNTYIQESVNAVVVNADSGKPIVLDYNQSTGKLSFYFARKYVKWEAMNIKGQECAAFRVVFRLGGTYNGHALFQRYIGSTPLTPPVPTAPQLKTAFMRGANYQNANKSVSANASEAIYDDGASVTLLVDGSKTYTLLRAYNKDDVELNITGASLALSASGSNYQLKLNWGATAAQICYIEYTVS
jgi:hypothetical protein